MYVRKTVDRWDIEVNYEAGNEWEVASSYYDMESAMRDLKEYRIHTAAYGGRCRLVKRRERKEQK